MSFFKSLASVVVQTVLLPVEAVKDVVTMGGAMTEQDTPYTLQRLNKIGDKINDTVDDLED